MRSTVVLLATVVAFAWAPSAGAHQDPPGCTTGAINIQFTVASDLAIIHRNGDQLQIGARVRNDAAGACTYDDVAINVHLPNPDGTLGPPQPLATGVDLPAPTAQHDLTPTVPYTVNLNPGVFRAPVRLSYSGTAHFAGGDITGDIGSTQTNVVISRPHITLGVARNPASGPAPLGVTYTYTAINDSPVDSTAPTTTPDLVAPNDRSIVSDNLCSPVTYVSGDPDMTSPPLLHDGETWTLTCSRIFDNPGTFTNTATIVGNSLRDGRPWPDTTAQASVTVQGSDMTVSKSHAGDFAAGATGQTYSLVARNSGNQATSGSVSLQDSLPGGLSATSISGDGWSCDLGTLTCTRSDPLAGGASYPPVTVTVDVAADAPEQVTNVATVSGGGEVPTGNNAANDPTTITRSSPPPPPAPPPAGGNDTDPPDGKIRKVKVRGDDATVTFRSDERGSTFDCRLDKKKFKPCTSPKRYRSLDDGKHKVFVLATDAAGNEDTRAAKAKFEVG